VTGTDPKAMNNATGKRLLALVRGADHAHPGEEEANRRLFAGLAPDPDRRILDAGCGGGGTAVWVQEHGYGTVTGMEIDADTVLLARERHPEVAVVEGDLQTAAGVLAGPFDLVYAMTALHAAPDQPAVFAQLGALAAPGAELRLLEYSDPHGRFAAATRGHPSWMRWRPLVPSALSGTLAAAGRSLVELQDLGPELTRWYEDLCLRIVAKQELIEREFGADWYESVAAEYNGILGSVRRGDLGGVVVHAVVHPPAV